MHEQCSDSRRPYETPALEVENFFEEVGVFKSGCTTHYCSTSGYCSAYNGNDCD